MAAAAVMMAFTLPLLFNASAARAEARAEAQIEGRGPNRVYDDVGTIHGRRARGSDGGERGGSLMGGGGRGGRGGGGRGGGGRGGGGRGGGGRGGGGGGGGPAPDVIATKGSTPAINGTEASDDLFNQMQVHEEQQHYVFKPQWQTLFEELDDIYSGRGPFTSDELAYLDPSGRGVVTEPNSSFLTESGLDLGGEVARAGTVRAAETANATLGGQHFVPHQTHAFDDPGGVRSTGSYRNTTSLRVGGVEQTNPYVRDPYFGTTIPVDTTNEPSALWNLAEWMANDGRPDLSGRIRANSVNATVVADSPFMTEPDARPVSAWESVAAIHRDTPISESVARDQARFAPRQLEPLGPLDPTPFDETQQQIEQRFQRDLGWHYEREKQARLEALQRANESLPAQRGVGNSLLEREAPMPDASPAPFHVERNLEELEAYESVLAQRGVGDSLLERELSAPDVSAAPIAGNQSLYPSNWDLDDLAATTLQARARGNLTRSAMAALAAQERARAALESNPLGLYDEDGYAYEGAEVYEGPEADPDTTYEPLGDAQTTYDADGYAVDAYEGFEPGVAETQQQVDERFQRDLAREQLNADLDGGGVLLDPATRGIGDAEFDVLKFGRGLAEGEVREENVDLTTVVREENVIQSGESLASKVTENYFKEGVGVDGLDMAGPIEGTTGALKYVRLSDEAAGEFLGGYSAYLRAAKQGLKGAGRAGFATVMGTTTNDAQRMAQFLRAKLPSRLGGGGLNARTALGAEFEAATLGNKALIASRAAMSVAAPAMLAASVGGFFITKAQIDKAVREGHLTAHQGQELTNAEGAATGSGTLGAVAGSVIGARALGSLLIPLPIVGSLIGGAIGGIVSGEGGRALSLAASKGEDTEASRMAGHITDFESFQQGEGILENAVTGLDEGLTGIHIEGDPLKARVLAAQNYMGLAPWGNPNAKTSMTELATMGFTVEAGARQMNRMYSSVTHKGTEDDKFYSQLVFGGGPNNRSLPVDAQALINAEAFERYSYKEGEPTGIDGVMSGVDASVAFLLTDRDFLEQGEYHNHFINSKHFGHAMALWDHSQYNKTININLRNPNMPAAVRQQIIQRRDEQAQTYFRHLVQQAEAQKTNRLARMRGELRQKEEQRYDWLDKTYDWIFKGETIIKADATRSDEGDTLGLLGYQRTDLVGQSSLGPYADLDNLGDRFTGAYQLMYARNRSAADDAMYKQMVANEF